MSGEPRLVRLPPDSDRRPKPTWADAVVIDQTRSGDRYWCLRLEAPKIACTAQPGQFVMITAAPIGAAGPVLPRPMAVSSTDQSRGWLSILYGVVGAGTTLMTTLRPGATVVMVGPLGRAFELPSSAPSVLMLGRGIGICSLTMLAGVARARGSDVLAVSSGRNPDAIVGREEYAAQGIVAREVYDSDSTSDPARLGKWLQTQHLARPIDFIAVCGSHRLTRLAADLGRTWSADVQVSIEAHMACGLGYCHGCSTVGDAGSVEAPLVCRDGPVFRAGVG